MKKDFFDIIDQKLAENKDIFLLLGDLGYPRYDELKDKYPTRVFNCGASEQTMLDIAVGIAYEGKIPFCYTITPFLLRGWETIRTFLNHENLHCVLIGAGVGTEYSLHDGFSHDAQDIKGHFDLMENIIQHYPDDKAQLIDDIDMAINIKKGHFINIHK